MTAWEPLLRLRQGELAPVQITVWRDNVDDGLVIGMDEGDGAKVIAVPLSAKEAQALAQVLLSKEAW